jgi:tRNA-splicing ligase RtcB
MEIKLKNIGINRWQIEQLPAMKAEAVIYAKEELLDQAKNDRSLEQLVQAASLPRLISPVIAMPDVHQGFGLPIGGVMATDNLVSSGAVGMDINCGVRLLISQISHDSKKFSPEALKTLIHSIERGVPVGLGGRRREKIKGLDFHQVIVNGVQALVKKGYAEREDLDSIEESGKMTGAKIENLSQ